MDEFNNVCRKSQTLRKIIRDIRGVADEGLPILLQGETGTGKTYLARVIHTLLDKSDALFVPLDCATFNPNLIESELFGHEKGAFTDARDKKSGLFEMACGGTVLVEEIENLPPDLQAKLLRILDEKKFRRVGGTEDLDAYFQLISTINVDVDDLLESGHLRKDLFYRISAFSVTLPPLRERREDILIFADYFLQLIGQKYGGEFTLTKDVRDYLFDYPWPGNIRELKNTLSVVTRKIKRPRLTPEDFAAVLQRTNSHSSERSALSLADIQKEHITRVLSSTGYKIGKTAEILGISENTLRAKIKKYKIKKS